MAMPAELSEVTHEKLQMDGALTREIDRGNLEKPKLRGIRAGVDGEFRRGHLPRYFRDLRNDRRSLIS